VLELSLPVERIADGDTLVVTWDDRAVEKIERAFDRRVDRDPSRGLAVRLFAIDAPEMGQEPWGEKVKNRLTELVEPYDRVTLQVRDLDPYSRLVAEVFVENCSVNLQLIAEGWCLAYFRWLKGSDRWDDFANAHDRAKDRKLNFWGAPDFMPPGEWRQQNRDARGR